MMSSLTQGEVCWYEGEEYIAGIICMKLLTIPGDQAATTGKYNTSK